MRFMVMHKHDKHTEAGEKPSPELIQKMGQLIGDYASYINSFIQIRDPHINSYVQQKLQDGVLWPEPLIQINGFC